MTAHKNVLIVDDELNAIKVLSAILKGEGYTVFESLNVENAIGVIHKEDIDAIITDLKMPIKDGFQFFEYVSQHHPNIPVMFLTAFGTVESAVNAMTCGAYYYFIKPPDYQKLKNILARAIDQRCLKREFENIKNKFSKENNACHITGKTPPIQRIFKTIESFKDTESSILIHGDTGTGKEIIARSLHYNSKRFDKPFITVNCAAIPRELMESELFGYEKGAFTGAMVSRIGKFEEASDGTIFLDEIGELELPLQAKLLRVLQEREIERLGNNKRIRVNFRLISSTNRDLKKEIKAGNFREDLFYRINVVQIDVPPLRERREDIPLLTSRFVHEFCLREKKMITLSEEVMKIFENCPWPGNVRQLRNVIERAVILAKGANITMHELPEDFHHYRDQEKPASSASSVKPLKMLELQAIANALHECNGNKSKAARKLGISRKAFYKKLKDSAMIFNETATTNKR